MNADPKARIIELGKHLETVRDSIDISQSELARRMVARGWKTYSQMTVSRTEKGDRAVGAVEYFDLMYVLGEPVGQLNADYVEVTELREFKRRVLQAVRGEGQ